MAQQSPAHYTRGAIEVWDFIRDQELNYHLGNAIKYICRAGFKGDNTKAQDLKKAIHYLENELEHTTLHQPKSRRSSDSISQLVRGLQLEGEPDYATGFDR